MKELVRDSLIILAQNDFRSLKRNSAAQRHTIEGCGHMRMMMNFRLFCCCKLEYKTISECRSLIEKTVYNNDVFVTLFSISNIRSSCFVSNVGGQTTGL
jgi:hypothetical protein